MPSASTDSERTATGEPAAEPTLAPVDAAAMIACGNSGCCKGTGIGVIDFVFEGDIVSRDSDTSGDCELRKCEGVPTALVVCKENEAVESLETVAVRFACERVAESDGTELIDGDVERVGVRRERDRDDDNSERDSESVARSRRAHGITVTLPVAAKSREKRRCMCSGQ
jgi:hypothetical protein